VELDACYLRETAMAVLVNCEGKEVWIPDSQIDEDSEIFVGCKLSAGEVSKLICSEWIATEKGLV
jgi:hypothetical protein